MWELDYKENRLPQNWCFWTVQCWRRLLRVPWTARRSSQSILKEISPEYSLEGLMLKLKLQYFGHLMWRTDLLEKTLMLGKIEGRRKRRQQRMKWMASLTRWAWVCVGFKSWWWTGKPGVLYSPWGHKESDTTEQLTALNPLESHWKFFSKYLSISWLQSLCFDYAELWVSLNWDSSSIKVGWHFVRLASLGA